MPGKNDIKLILTDIDGTILPKGQRVVSQRVIAAFHAAMDAGIHVGPASGRGIGYVAPAFGGDAACVQTALATNGMQVYLDGQLLIEKHLPHPALLRLAEVMRDVPDAGMIVFEGDDAHLVCGDRELLRQSFPRYAEVAAATFEVPDIPVVKCNLFAPTTFAQTQAVIDIARTGVPELGYNLPLEGFVNVTPLGWSKASGVDALCETLGIGLDQVVVFGDGGNDVEMLEHVPNSVAVADAADDAAAAARWHVGTCESEAVAAAIEQIAAGEWPFA